MVMIETMTVNQQRALECVQQARKRGIALCVYAREQGLSERVIYDAVAALRRKGILPAAGSTAAPTMSDFVAVRMAPMSAMHSTVCRVQVGSTLIECHQWPPATWLATLGQVSADAATAGY
jgi:hypothetical protein